MKRLYIDTPKKLADLCDKIRSKAWLTVDTEFLRETTYYPKLCLLQLATDNIAACVDPLALDDLSLLWERLYDPTTIKVFHAARQDLEIFFNHQQQLPTPIFDTQPAAALLGIGDQVGYAVLVEKLLGLKLDKGHTRTDWSRRPLDPQQIDYAYNDVIHLTEVYLKMRDRLEQLGRLQWLDDDFSELTDPATYIVEPEQAWKKVKGRQTLRGVQYAVLQQLAGWRERQAIADSRPRRRILKDEILIDLSRRTPNNIDQIERIRGMDKRDAKRWGQKLLELIEQGRNLPHDKWPQERIPPKLKPQQEALVDTFSAALRLIADQHGLTPSSIAGRKEIERFVSGDEMSSLLHGWRLTVAGRKLQALMQGQASLELTNGELRLK